MVPVQLEVDRALTLLRNKIREQGFTQLEVQEALGWGRSYISQLLTRQKALRVEQVLSILNVIGIDPSEFFAELYAFPAVARKSTRAANSDAFMALRREVRGLTTLLVEKNLITLEDLSEAVSTATQESRA